MTRILNVLRKTAHISVLMVLVLLVSCARKAREPFSFVQICDPQLGMGGYEHDMETFKQAVRQINALGCDFVVICGDLVHHASDSAFNDFLRIKADLNIPCYYVPGNHDIGKVPTDTSLAYYRQKLGKDYYAFTHKGYAFIATNTQLWKADVGEESERHEAWFKDTLRALSAGEHPVFVIGHYPFYIKHPEEEEQYSNLPAEKRKEILALLVENNVVAYLSGHRHEAIIHNYQGIQLVTGETTSKNFDKRPMGFRQWDVSGDTVRHFFVPLEESVSELADSLMAEVIW